jgi:hypothetical protein
MFLLYMTYYAYSVASCVAQNEDEIENVLMTDDL